MLSTVFSYFWSNKERNFRDICILSKPEGGGVGVMGVVTTIRECLECLSLNENWHMLARHTARLPLFPINFKTLLAW